MEGELRSRRTPRLEGGEGTMGESDRGAAQKERCGLARTGLGNKFQPQRGEVGIIGPGLQGGAKATLPSRDVTRGMDSSFFDD